MESDPRTGPDRGWGVRRVDARTQGRSARDPAGGAESTRAGPRSGPSRGGVREGRVQGRIWVEGQQRGDRAKAGRQRQQSSRWTGPGSFGVAGVGMGDGVRQVRSLGGEVIGLPEPGLERRVRAGRTRTMASWCQRKGWARGQGQGCTRLQQQLHHAQVVVFHSVDEWGAAALNVLRQRGKVFKYLQAQPKQLSRQLGPASLSC